MDNLFEKLNGIDVNAKTEKKDKLTYLSWAWAWTEFKKVYPTATYQVKKNEDGLPYFDSQCGIMVYTEVTADNLTYEMWLPVLDYRNKALKTDTATMFDINKTLMRCLTKNLAMFGLGIYIYAGEDLPEGADLPTVPQPISEELLAEAQELKISLENLASYYKCSVSELTAKDIEKAIELKVSAQKKKEQANASNI